MKFILDALFADRPQTTSPELTEKELQLATAALLVEVATIDRVFDDQELARLQSLLEQRFSLSRTETQQLIDEASHASNDASSLYEFTKHINEQLAENDKIKLVEGLWEIAYADQTLDKHEEHIIRRIADLIHVRHIDFIRTKNAVRDKHQTE